MRKKIVGILICIILLLTSVLSTLIIPENIHVEAYREGEEPEYETGLDLDYIWTQLGIVSNVIHDAYLPGDIPKGRSFGSKGGEYTVENILEPEMRNTSDLTNIKTERLQTIDTEHNNYSSIINVSDFSLTINPIETQSYPYENPIPKKEMFPIAYKFNTNNNNEWSLNYSFSNAEIKRVNITKINPIWWALEGCLEILERIFLNNDYSPLLGNVTYIPENGSVPSPDEQYTRVFLLDDVNGVQEKLENITNASGVIIIDTGNPRIADASDCPYPVVLIYNASGNVVKELLEDYTVVVDNVHSLSRKLTFTYDPEESIGQPYVIIDRIPDYNEFLKFEKSPNIRNNLFYHILLKWSNRTLIQKIFNMSKLNPGFQTYLSCLQVKTDFLLCLSKRCKGIILYDSDDYHFMWSMNTQTMSIYFNKPIICVNKSVGQFLRDHCDDFTLSGFIDQTYLEEKQNAPGAIGENIYGNKTINKSPNDAIAIISNRYDGMWGQTPGDSGVGTAIVLGIAKYFKDHPSVKPKYNLTFLFTTAEEYGFHGARFHCDKHSDQNIKYWLIHDQLGFDQEDCKLCLEYNDTNNPIPNFNKILDEIIKDSGYPEDKILKRTGKDLSSGSEQGTIDGSDLNCTTLHLGKDQDRRWDHWHRTGNNYIEGDSIKNIDRDDVNATARLTLGLVKYFMVNPDCRFNGSITYTTVDSPNDSDTLNDSINATFSVKTSLPVDKVRVRAMMKTENNLTRFWKDFDFNATSESIQKTITVTLPPTFLFPGEYHLYLQLFNSTERINETVAEGSGKCNDTDSQTNWNNVIYPRGNTNANKPDDIQGPDTLKVLETGIFNSSATDPNNDQLQYHWDWSIDFDRVGPYASGVNCTNDYTYISKGDKIIKVKVREDYKGQLYDGGLFMELFRYGSWSQWSDPFSVHVDPLIDFDFTRTAAASAQSATQSTMLPSILDIDSIYEGFAFGGTAPYTYSWYFEDVELPESEQTVTYNFSQPGIKTVSLSVTDDNDYSEEITVNITVVNISASYNVSLPSLYAILGETIIFNDTSAVISNRSIENWTWDFSDDAVCYEQNTSHSYYCPGLYNVSLTVTDNETETDTYVQTIIVDYDDTPPMITSVLNSPDETGFGFNVSIVADVIDNISGVKAVYTNITKPDSTTLNITMMHIINNFYYAICNNTWQTGIYNYSIWAVDYANNTGYVSGFNFTVSAEATITVCTTKDTYAGNEFINLTDPPGNPSPSLGYELLDDGAMLHLWNRYDSYYFNTTSGIQLTNHKDDYWSHNVLMLGYYNNDQWNLLYRTDELTGFTKNIETDGTSYVNVTLWKDLSYAGYPFRLAIRYHLGVNDHDLTVIPYIKNLGTASIPYVLGFGWELKDIQINMTTEGDYIIVDGESYYLNQTLENVYTDLNETVFYLMDDSSETQTQSLYLRWDSELTYKLQVKSRSGQQNAPVALFIQVGTLAVGQQKHTLLHWYDASQETYYFNAFDANEAWEYNPELMTDETEETFASTRTDTTVELCNGNTCEGDDLGTISKVELRVNGYYEGKDGGNITVRPIFEETDGENYTFTATERPEWSQWFDITNDVGRGGGGLLQWSWSEVNKLDCDVEASVGAETTLFCSMIQLRVTYNTAPSVSNPYPPHGTNGITLQPQLNITVSDPDGDTMNVTWYTNSTPSLLTLRPNANGSITELQRYPTSQNANYKCVDETIVNDNDYVYWSGTSWKKDTYNLANRGAVSGVIHSMTVYTRCNRAGFGMDPSVPNQGKIVIRSNGSYYYGNEFTPTSTFTSYSHTWSVNPATGNAWNWSAIDSLQAGIAFIGDEGTSRCSHLYILVNYTDPSTWLQIGGNSSVYDGVYHQRFLNASMNGQWWYWKVKADDGSASTWSSVYKFYTGYQSNIENTGETNIKGYLLMQVQYFNEPTENWIVDNDTVNETTPRIINSSCQLGLDTIFNGQVRASDLTHDTGTYRVYVAFRDPEGTILRTNDGAELKAWWQFSKI